MNNTDKILLSHGSGGTLMHNLIRDLFLNTFGNKILDQMDDSAYIPGSDICFTTDSYVINPLFFPGGDIGKLAVCGTINDLAVMGSVPLYISLAVIAEEGLEYKTLEKVVKSIDIAAKKDNIKIVTGDFKVVEKGNADKLYINTSGVGKGRLKQSAVKPGDKIIINGSIGDHGIAVLTSRNDFMFENTIKSDCCSLKGLIRSILKSKPDIKFMRDPTRGGLATTLNEIAKSKNICINLFENCIPMHKDVSAACELLGFDPLYLANEGKVVIIVSNKDAEKVLRFMRKHPNGRKSRIIGEITKNPAGIGRVILNTRIGGSRVVDMLTGDQLPRIC